MTASSRSILGIVTLSLGALSLVIAVTLTIVYQLPPPWKEDKPVEPKIEGQKHIEWHGVKFKWGGKVVKEDEQVSVITIPKALHISSAILAVAGLFLGPLAWYRERRYVLAGPGMGLCCIALVWQYLLLGIMIGAAAAVLLMLLASFSN